MTETDPTLSPEVATLLDAVDRALDPPAARDPLTAILLQPAVRRLLPILEQRGALARWLPELAVLRGVSQLPDHRMDALDHSFQACASAPPTVLSRWTALLHDRGKATTVVYTPEGRTRFFGHELVGAELAAQRLPPGLSA